MKNKRRLSIQNDRSIAISIEILYQKIIDFVVYGIVWIVPAGINVKRHMIVLGKGVYGYMRFGQQIYNRQSLRLKNMMFFV